MGKQKQIKAKNKKTAWKKIQHADIEDHLDEVRQDERLGIPEKSDEQLFCIDTGSESTTTLRQSPRKSNICLVDTESLKCFQILKPHTSVPDPIIKRNRLHKPGEKKTLDMKMKDEMRYYKKDMKRNPLSAPNKRRHQKTHFQHFDLWGDEEAVLAPNLPNFKKFVVNFVADSNDLQDDTKHHIVNPIKHKVNRKTSALSAIEIPHPGLSYNPSFKDHQDVISLASEEEKRKLAKAQKLIKATEVIRSTKSEEDDDEEEVEIKEESEDDEKTLVLQPKPKTRQQKRREKEQLELQRDSRLRKINNVRESQVFRIKSLVKEIDKKDATAKTRLAKKVKKIQEREKVGVKTLSKHNFVNLPLDPILSENLSGSLRRVPVDLSNPGGILLDRFKSLQKRNIVETRVKVKMTRKNKLVKYQRPSEKMEWEKTGEWNGIKLPMEIGRGNRRRRFNKSAK